MTSNDYSPPGRVPLSILDLAIVPEGGSGAAAIRGAVATAQLAENLGYRRYWFAEHHLAAGVASSAPAVLAALVAANTRRIRVGSGAVLLSTTSPLVAAEQFGTIAALHPGRVDLGLGRAFGPPPAASAENGGAPSSGESAPLSPPAPLGPPAASEPPAPLSPPAASEQGTLSTSRIPANDRAVSASNSAAGLRIPAPPPLNLNDSQLRERLLSQQKAVGARRTPAPFRTELEAVLALRAGQLPTATGNFTSPPADGADFELWPLASSGGESARVAGELGLPLAANYHVSPATILDTVSVYRESFVPGVLAEPYVLVSADVLVAPDEETAAHRGEPFASWVLSIRAGAAGAVQYPKPGTSAALSAQEFELVRDRLETRFVGTAQQVVAGLEGLVAATGADELLITTQTWDPAHTQLSHSLLAAAWTRERAHPVNAQALADSRAAAQ